MSFVCPECARIFPDPGFCTEHGASLQDAAIDPLLGQVVGSYRIARLIGRGGMGEVYLGVQPQIGSRVAIKLLSIHAALSPGLVDRFFAEARAVNVVRHEGIVSVIDLSRLPDGRPYIVMEYLDGAPLASVLERHRPVPLGGFVQLVLSVLDALGAAHAHGITHRDLKPDNVFVTTLGRTKILDFGIAKLRPDIAQMSDQTRTGALLGTPYYMSPEQARARAVDHRSDLYSLGVILYEGVTGQRPFSGDNLYDVLRQQIEIAPPRPSQLRPEIPAALETVILRALEKDPALRFGTTAEFSNALLAAARFLPADSFVTLAGKPGQPLAARVVSAGPTMLPTSPGYAATVPGSVTASAPRKRTALWIALGGVALIALLAATAMGTLLVFGDRDTITVIETPAPAADDPSADDPIDDVFDPAEPAAETAGLDKVDAVAFYPQALKLAREKFPDAELQTLIVHSPEPDGTAVFEKDGLVTYTFKSAKASQGQAASSCLIWVSLAGGPPTISTPPMGSCMTASVRAPRCTVGQVVKKARTSGEGVLMTYGPTPYWQVIDDTHDLPRTFADDC